MIRVYEKRGVWACIAGVGGRRCGRGKGVRGVRGVRRVSREGLGIGFRV